MPGGAADFPAEVKQASDDGKNWERVTPPDLPDFTRISLIEASPHDAGTAYLAGNRYQRADRAPYVYKTSDYGKSWSKIVTGLPPNDSARAIREDTKRRGLLFLGTDSGIYVSFDAGANWQSRRFTGSRSGGTISSSRPTAGRSTSWTTSPCCVRSRAK